MKTGIKRETTQVKDSDRATRTNIMTKTEIIDTAITLVEATPKIIAPLFPTTEGITIAGILIITEKIPAKIITAEIGGMID